MAALAERRPVRLLRPAPPEMGRQSQRFVLEFRDEAGHDKFVKTNEEMLHVKALIALLLAEKTQLLLRIERAAAVIAGAAVRRWTTVVLESSGRDCAQKRVKLMSNIEHIEVLVETIRARIDTLKSDPDPDPDDATRADLERCINILAALEEGRGRLMSLKMNPLTALA